MGNEVNEFRFFVNGISKGKYPSVDGHNVTGKQMAIAFPFALLQVCRLIYSKTATMPFSANTFYFNIRSRALGWIDTRHSGQWQAIQTLKMV